MHKNKGMYNTHPTAYDADVFDNLSVQRQGVPRVWRSQAEKHSWHLSSNSCCYVGSVLHSHITLMKENLLGLINQ